MSRCWIHPDLTGRENIFINAAILGMKGTKKKFKDIVEFSNEKFIEIVKIIHQDVYETWLR